MSLNEAVNMVRQFHQHIGAPIADKPQLLAGKQKEADFLAARIENLGRLARRSADNDPFLERLALALEELAEWATAHAKRDLVAAADAWADRAYVLLGDAVACGLPAQELFDEVASVQHDEAVRRSDRRGQGVSRYALQAAANPRDTGRRS